MTKMNYTLILLLGLVLSIPLVQQGFADTKVKFQVKVKTSQTGEGEICVINYDDSDKCYDFNKKTEKSKTVKFGIPLSFFKLDGDNERSSGKYFILAKIEDGNQADKQGNVFDKKLKSEKLTLKIR